MRHRFVGQLVAALMVAGLGASYSEARPVSVPTITAAVAAPTRSPDNVKLDVSRKPAELLAFLGLKPGMRVADMFGVNHYWAEIFAAAVGPRGQVVVWEPTQFYGDKARADFAAFAATRPNVAIVASPFATPALAPRSFDLMLLNLDYHDVYWQSAKYKIAAMEPDAWLKVIYAAMKPGGIVGVVDHVGPAGDTRAIVEELHRIDPAVVRADFERAGFVLDGESPLLRNPADDHKLLVFDPAIRGKTDRFALRFRKPR
ncbi:class I SAM-dependent methyltransferase [Sphingomonas sp. RB1R13]|uniref:class I SAM-dependent methyltransferase n=1 Tax=Sphingomonas sp. RB1R13 TaxID=3096159 RepID=UPI002FCA62F7